MSPKHVRTSAKASYEVWDSLSFDSKEATSLGSWMNETILLGDNLDEARDNLDEASESIGISAHSIVFVKKIS